MDVDPGVVVAMAEAARWAPSVHNSQPWRFRARPDGLDVLVDARRTLPGLDPDGRLRTVSCGAAVAAAGCAATALGLATRTALLPDSPRGEVVARLVCVARRTPTTADRRLAAEVPRRRTHPVLHPGCHVGADQLEELAATVEDEGVGMTLLDPAGSRALAGLLVEALDEHRRRPALWQETQDWLRLPSRARRPVDGVLRGSLSAWPYRAGSEVRVGAVPGGGGPAVGTPGDMTGDLTGTITGDPADDLVEDPAGGTTVLVWTPTDARRDQVLAGVALQRLLLHAAALDVVASFCDVATQLPSTRARVGALLPRRGHVQVALRLGYQLVDVRTPSRRPLADLLVDHVDLVGAVSGPAVVDLRQREPGGSRTSPPGRASASR